MIPDEIYEKLMKSNNPLDRIKVARQGYGLDKLSTDGHWGVRNAVINYQQNLAY